jgi:dTDP-glucose 4,6-dehydratase
VEDQARGLAAMLDSEAPGPLNIGNPHEMTVLELAQRVVELCGSSSTIEFRPLPQDDPTQRRPDISAARELLGWAPEVSLDEGLHQTIEYFRRQLVA